MPILNLIGFNVLFADVTNDAMMCPAGGTLILRTLPVTSHKRRARRALVGLVCNILAGSIADYCTTYCKGNLPGSTAFRYGHNEDDKTYLMKGNSLYCGR